MRILSLRLLSQREGKKTAARIYHLAANRHHRAHKQAPEGVSPAAASLENEVEQVSSNQQQEILSTKAQPPR